MKVKIISVLIIFSIYSSQLISQVTSVYYQLEYVESTHYYNFNIVIGSGSAESTFERIFFNSQFSLVMPTDVNLSLVETVMPLEGNIDYQGTIPTDYDIGNIVDYLDNQYLSFSPQLSPSSWFNNIYPSDTVTLFVFDVGGFHEELRLYNNASDPSSSEMPGGEDFSNGFTIGGVNQVYAGNLPTIEPEVVDQTFEVNDGYSYTSRPVLIAESTVTPDQSAILDLQSTTKGFLPPRMTASMIQAIEDPKEGLMVFNISSKLPIFYDGTVWKTFDGSAVEW